MNIEPDPTRSLIDIELDISDWIESFPELHSHVEEAVAYVLQLFPHSHKFYSVCLVFSDDKTVQELNKTYRHQDKPTNVLSFPSSGHLKELLPLIHLGDIIFAFETVKREAEEQHKTLREHALHLVVHGLLHLLGYDHIDPVEAEEMEALEIEILQHMHIKNPYEVNDIETVH